MTEEVVTERIGEYIEENFLYMRPDLEIERDTPLLESGVLDSMGVIELIEFLESEFEIEVDEGEITEDNLETIEAATDLVVRKRAS